MFVLGSELGLTPFILVCCVPTIVALVLRSTPGNKCRYTADFNTNANTNCSERNEKFKNGNTLSAYRQGDHGGAFNLGIAASSASSAPPTNSRGVKSRARVFGLFICIRAGVLDGIYLRNRVCSEG